jgi:ankyrin repeat protein
VVSNNQQAQDQEVLNKPARVSGRAWEIPDISSQLSSHLLSAYLEDKDRLNPKLAFALFISRKDFSLKGLGSPGRIDTSFRLLRTAALGGRLQAQSLIFLCYEYHNMVPDKEIEVHRRAWTFDCIASGCLAFSKAARLMDPDRFDAAVALFQASGGYNWFYKSAGARLLARLLDLRHEVIRPGVSRDEPLTDVGDSLVHALCSFNRSAALSVLKTIATSANINIVNERGESPLYFACMGGAFETVIFLLSLGADPTLRPHGDSPSCLHWLIAFHPDRIEEVADKLIDNGASTGTISKRLDKMFHYPFALPAGSPLHWAVEFSCVEAIRALLKHSADPWLPNGVKQFIFSREIPEFQPDESFDAMVFDYDAWVLGGSAGPSAVEVAVQNWDHDILRLLLEHAPRKTTENLDDEICVFHHLIAGDFRWISDTSRFFNPLVRGGRDTRRLKLQRTIDELMSFGFDINSLSTTWISKIKIYRITNTSLMLAVHNRDIEVVTALLEAGADVNLAGSDGRTAIMYPGPEYTTPDMDEYDVRRAFQVQMIKMLLAHGAQIDVRDDKGRSPILSLAEDQLFGAVEVLLAEGANVSDNFVLHGTIQEAQDWKVFCLLAGVNGHNEGHTQTADRELGAMLRKHVVPLLVPSPSRDPLSAHETLLYCLAGGGFLESAAVLLDAGIYVNTVWAPPLKPHANFPRPPRTALDNALHTLSIKDRYAPRMWSTPGK